jgi:hypothetical protein
MDVESILQQIRERVIAEEDAPATSKAPAYGAPANGSGPPSGVNESLTRAAAHLAVTRRAWDRLPPVCSNRSGTLARFELWIKRRCKPLTHWFTWEQVNFNRAVNDALGDVIEILKVEAHELASLHAQLTSEMHREFVTLRSEIEASGAGLKSEIEASGAGLKSEIEASGARLNETNAALARLSEMLGSLAEEARGGHSELANKLNALAAALRAEQQTEKTAQDEELNRRLAELAAELREDQRVCFRQLSLETSESAVLEDRGRRELLARLERLESSQQRR